MADVLVSLITPLLFVNRSVNHCRIGLDRDRSDPCVVINCRDSYWFSRFPGANKTDANTQTLLTGPINATSSVDFYETLLDNRRYWDAELAAEGMMDLSLPSPNSTNGTWLKQQAVHSIVRSMITRQNTWEPRYGVCPGNGAPNMYGIQDVFTTTTTAALEFGAMAYAKGVVDYQFKHYIRHDGMTWSANIELPTTARMLTVLAMYHWYSDESDDEFLLRHFGKAETLANWLVSRRELSLTLDKTDPRYGIPMGGDDAQHDADTYFSTGTAPTDPTPAHWYASAAELYRAFTDIGEVWAAVGKSSGRADVAVHGAKLLELAPMLYNDLHVSMNKTVKVSSSGEHCWSPIATANAESTVAPPGPSSPELSTFRAFSELLWSGALTPTQAADITNGAAGGSSCGAQRFLALGSPGIGGATIATPTAFGFGHALLQHDEVEKFLLHYFAISAHAYTRGTFTTPESSDIGDRDVPPMHYASAGVHVSAITSFASLCLFSSCSDKASLSTAGTNVHEVDAVLRGAANPHALARQGCAPRLARGRRSAVGCQQRHHALRSDINVAACCVWNWLLGEGECHAAAELCNEATGGRDPAADSDAVGAGGQAEQGDGGGQSLDCV